MEDKSKWKTLSVIKRLQTVNWNGEDDDKGF